jgi:pimeloyl-ACP methyl ester carboxylesterase/2-polyprenyl-6-methoxyphenol hydroxylase-like FAD-dependent oxidoreductase
VNGDHGTHAIVIGASMAGLLSARVLAEHFERVTVIERDRLPQGPEFRSGVPQSRHLHALLVQGRVLLEELFPGLEAALFAAGALNIRVPTDTLILSPGGWCRRFVDGVTLLSCSRELLEWSVRQRVGAAGTVAFLPEHEVIGLLSSADHGAVLGVQVRPRGRLPGVNGAAGGDERGGRPGGDGTLALRAELVVDASGRGSRAPRWLEAMGYRRPPETKINAFLGYASRYYRRPPRFSADWQGILLAATPSEPRGAVLLPIEGGRWHVTLAGYGRNYPPVDEAGFLEFARRLRSPIVSQAIQEAEPLSPIRGYQRTENILRHYERLPRWPAGFVVLGDAVSAFNPVYGQGMTAAAQAALTLDRCLREIPSARLSGGSPTLGQRFQRRLARANGVIWLLATGEDLRYPTTEGGRPGLLDRLMHRYLDRVFRVVPEDAEVSLAFWSVVHLLAPPTSLVHPRILLPALRGPTSPRLPAPPVHAGPEPVPDGAPDTGPDAARDRADRASSGLAHGYADLGDVRLHYVEAGASGAGPAGAERPLVVLLHGFPEFWYSWRRQIPALAAAGYHVVAPDLRGYNLSDKPRGVHRYRIDLLALDVERLIRRCGAERAVVCGHDWGGGVAWAVAMRYPELVERLVVINAPHPARFLRALRTPRQLRKSWYMFFFQVPWLPEACLRTSRYAALRRAFTAPEGRPGAFSAEDIERYVEAAARPGALTAGINYYRALFRQAPRQAQASLRRIEAPVLVIWGERDPYLGRELASPDGAWVPNARVERLPQAGHWAQLEEPERVNALLLEFLARPPGPATSVWPMRRDGQG